MTHIVLDRVADSESRGAAAAAARTLRSTQAAAVARPGAVPRRTARQGRGSGRAAGPVLRPVVACPAPPLAPRPKLRAQACELPAPAMSIARAAVTAAAPTWRLTERGVAVVLVIGMMIMVAALTVVGLTALKVTSDGYQSTVSASLPR